MHNTKQLAEKRKLLRVCKPYLLHFHTPNVAFNVAAVNHTYAGYIATYYPGVWVHIV